MEHLRKTAKKIVINLKDIDAENATNIFIKDLEAKFTEFNERYKANYEKYEKEGLLGNVNYQFYPEELQKKSPLTILNAPWGTGKTRFVENLIRLIIKKQVKPNIFNNIILIDSWKYSTSKDVPLEFLNEISKRIVSMKVKEEDQELKEEVRNRLFSKLTLNAKLKFNFLNFCSVELGTELEKKFDEKAEKNIEIILNDIENNSTPILLFIDNIERLGKFTWDLLKTIIKLQELPNFQIVLPLSLNQISGNEKKENEAFEYPIEKYIDFSYYDLVQNYVGYLTSLFNNDDLVKNLNDIFNSEIKGLKLSVRQVSHYCKEYKLDKLDNEYDVLLEVVENIWPAYTVISSILQKDFDKFINFNKIKCNLMQNVLTRIENKSVGDVLSLPELDMYDIKTNTAKYYNLNKNYINDFKKIKKHFYKEVIFLKNDLANETNKAIEIIKEIENLGATLDKTLNEYNDFQQKLKNFNDNELDYDTKEKSLLELNVQNNNKKLKALNNKIFDLNCEKDAIYFQKNSIKEKIKTKEMNFDIDEIIKKYKQININGSSLPKWKEDLFIRYISKNYKNWETMIDETFRFKPFDIGYLNFLKSRP